MEDRAVVVAGLDVLQEVVDRLRRLVGVELDDDVAHAGGQLHLLGPGRARPSAQRTKRSQDGFSLVLHSIDTGDVPAILGFDSTERPPALICTEAAVTFLASMTLRIHNTLSRSLEEFRPLRAGQVGMYVCGMTIYDLCHMGHLRMMMAFDVVYRWLRTLGYDVTYVRNITDIEDKIIKRALERRISIRELTDEMIAAMHADLGAVGVVAPTHEPRATDYVPQMLGLIGQLEAEGPGLPLVQRRRELRGAQVPGLRQAVGQEHRRVARRRARGRARRQGRPARLRALEGGQGRRARRRQVRRPLRPRPPGLAHRVLGDGLRRARRAVRHPRRRHGPDLPAPRERDRAKRRRQRRRPSYATGCTTDSSMSTTRRCPSRWATSSPSATC